MKEYYSKTIYIPTVTREGKITGQIERWEAHEKGILHKAFSVALFYNNQIILQIRKHPVFDTVIDVTASSHPEMVNGNMEDEKAAVIKTIEREWHVTVAKDSLKDIGSIYYKSPDPKSNYIEHEYCTFYRTDIDRLIQSDPEFAYGSVVVDMKHIKKNQKNFNLAPWVVEGLHLLV